MLVLHMEKGCENAGFAFLEACLCETYGAYIVSMFMSVNANGL